jgi:hypothetical protein
MPSLKIRKEVRDMTSKEDQVRTLLLTRYQYRPYGINLLFREFSELLATEESPTTLAFTMDQLAKHEPHFAYNASIRQGLMDNYGFSKEKAAEIVTAYLPVINQVGRYENSEDWVARLHQAVEQHYTPNDWMRRILA